MHKLCRCNVSFTIDLVKKYWENTFPVSIIAWYWASSLTWSAAAMQISESKESVNIRVELPQASFGKATWPPFEKALYSQCGQSVAWYDRILWWRHERGSCGSWKRRLTVRPFKVLSSVIITMPVQLCKQTCYVRQRQKIKISPRHVRTIFGTCISETEDYWIQTHITLSVSTTRD